MLRKINCYNIVVLASKRTENFIYVHLAYKYMLKKSLVGEAGLEPTTSCSQST